jgi:hypothetical protein
VLAFESFPSLSGTQEAQIQAELKWKLAQLEAQEETRLKLAQEETRLRLAQEETKLRLEETKLRLAQEETKRIELQRSFQDLNYSIDIFSLRWFHDCRQFDRLL